MAHPDVPAQVIETMRAYFRRFIAAGGSQFLEDWFDVERELTLGDARISARNKELWLSVVDQMEAEFLPGHRAEGAPSPKAVNTDPPPASANTGLFVEGKLLSEDQRERLFQRARALLGQHGNTPSQRAED
jgi:hypothetical protein